MSIDLSVAEAIRAVHRLRGDIERFPTGSVPVYSVGAGHVIKMFPADERAHFESEKAALGRIDGALSIPTPRLVSAGERDDWLYVVMTRLPGIALVDAWSAIDGEARERLVREVGRGLAQLHALPIDDLPGLTIDWPRFMADQRASCRERQLGGRLAAPWVDLVDGFLDRWMPADGGRRALLHTEVMRQHVLVEQRGNEWRLSGLLDFEPSVVGTPGYELASVGVFLTCAEPGLMRAFLEGYGAAADEDFCMRVMAYTLLHRYSRLRWYMERLPVGDARDLESLARRWFSP